MNGFNTGKYILANAVGGVISGAIGAAAAEASGTHPVLKGALVSGCVAGFAATVLIAIFDAQAPKQVTSSGLSGYQPRFP